MSATIGRIKSSITRANQHIVDLQLGLSAFIKSNPHTIRIENDSKTERRTYYIDEIARIPDPIANIAADVIQNLRSPLDQIAHQLVINARSGTKPNWNVYYPISGSATDYPATRNGQIKGVRQEVI